MDKTLIETPVFGSRTEVYRKIASTQSRVREIFKECPVESLVVTESQSHGIGRRGRRWESPEGGLYFSVLVRQGGEKKLFSMHALFSALTSFEKMGINADWKWPNDLIYQGNKLGGILTEILSHEWVAIGVGINAGLNREDFPEDIRNKISVMDIDKKKFIQNFLEVLKKLAGNNKLTDKDLNFLNSRLTLKGKTVRVGEVEGEVRGIDREGRLEISGNEKTELITSGTVVEVKRRLYPDVLSVAVDVGNTATRIGLLGPAGMIKTSVLPTRPHDDFPERLVGKIKKLFEKEIKLIKAVALSCVVSSLEKKTVKGLKTEISGDLVNVTSITRTGLKLKVRNPRQVGADRICNAVAAHGFYGGDIVVMDLGTANTFDVVSDSGEYLGGVIAPGIDSMRESLLKKADKLNEYDFKLPEKAIGDETSVSLNIGMYHTLMGQIQSILSAIKKEWKRDFKIIITGGGIERLSREYVENFIIDRDITLKGLAAILTATLLTKKNNLL